MIRKAVAADIEQIVKGYHEHFVYERAGKAYTVFQENVYPTEKDAWQALKDDALYVYEDDKMVAGSIIIDKVQPQEYRGITGFRKLPDDKVMVIHLLMVRPGMTGRGIASSLLNYAAELAAKDKCEVLRLDTGEQNIPAVSLYRKMGFQIKESAPMKVGGAITHKAHLFLERNI